MLHIIYPWSFTFKVKYNMGWHNQLRHYGSRTSGLDTRDTTIARALQLEPFDDTLKQAEYLY